VTEITKINSKIGEKNLFSPNNGKKSKTLTFGVRV